MRFALSTALLVVFACSFVSARTGVPTTGGSATASQTKTSTATVYIYRDKHFAGGALAPSVFCDDFELARMTNGRFLVAKFAAGKHLFRSNDNQEGMDLDLKGGQDYYIRMDVGPSTMKGLLVLVAPDEAGDEIKKLKPLDAANIKDSDH